ncbi:Low-affinity potassium transport protein [Durusdinium trenchii]|uniref:Low-affinity potassium transport protein n=1 Tax=Durusdinium trenchii TaxID=1381693 RepID=A0ABP0M477_9DINO
MFPAVHTLWLLLVVIALNVLGTIVTLVQELRELRLLCREKGVWALAGHNLLHGGDVKLACTALLGVVTMRLSADASGDLSGRRPSRLFDAFFQFPELASNNGRASFVFAALRHELDITGRVEGVEEAVITAENSLKGQAEKAAKHPSPDSDGIYTDFGFFKVLFEILSAYGTCGLSLGYENQTFSFSGVWSDASQMLLVATMILGRLRGFGAQHGERTDVPMPHATFT